MTEEMMKAIEIEKAEQAQYGWHYVRTDKNGTRYYQSCECDKCEGRGVIPYFAHVDSGVCFKCGGRGVLDRARTMKIMTEEHAAKLQANRLAKARANADNKNKATLKAWGFNENGETWAVLGNTYEIKDTLKALGAKYNPIIGWHLTEDTDEYPTIVITADEFWDKNTVGEYMATDERHDECKAKIRIANELLKQAENKSQHIGEVGDKLEIAVTLKRISGFTTNFSYMGETTFIYKFEDADDNIIIWKTAKAPAEFEPEMVEGATVTLQGTIKAHSEYKGELQTVLTRCKIK